jgi:hypothetical protein
LKGSGSGLIAVLSWHFPEDTEENLRKISVRISPVLIEIRIKHSLKKC